MKEEILSLFRLTNILFLNLLNSNAEDFEVGSIFDEIDKISKKNIELNLRGDFSPLKKSKYSVVKLFVVMKVLVF